MSFRATLGLAVAISTCLSTARAESPDHAWGYDNFGVPGLIEMPGALSRPDAELNLLAFSAHNQTRVAGTFQLTPRLAATFRYALQRDIPWQVNGPVYDAIYDRSFSLHYRLLDETHWRPALAIGLNDVVGNSLYSGEYLVATKTISPALRLTGGIGWGRLGQNNSFRNPLGVISKDFETRTTTDDPFGGGFTAGEWFHGDAALFGGVEYRPNQKWRFALEYSSDDYKREDGNAFRVRSPFNFAALYKLGQKATVTASYLYGSEIGVQLSYAINPKFNRHPSGLEEAPPPVVPRTAESARAVASWSGTPALLESRMRSRMAQQGLQLEGLRLSGSTLEVQILNARYDASSEALGRAARVMSALAPAHVSSFKITLSRNSMPVSTTTIPRDALARFEFDPVGGEQIRAVTTITDAPSRLSPASGVYPKFSYGIGPYFLPSYFDPDQPFRADIGLTFNASYEPTPGLIFQTRIDQKVIGNLDRANRPSNSILPHVRSDGDLYNKTDLPTIKQLTGAYYFRPGSDVFGRITGGYLETMYAGISGEILWAPQSSKLAFGAELNHVRQRDYDQLFGLRNFSATTGHISAYYQFSPDFYAQLDIGRYLAGDTGATFRLERTFDNGWKVGAFATKTNISATEFGEGSFDKGIMVSIPLGWIMGKPDQRNYQTVLRPVQRDGGARVDVPGRLYGTVRRDQASTLDGNWERFWR